MGLFDMHGNVWEWTADRYQSAYPTGNPVTDPTGPASGSPRVGRGGSWYGDGSYLRSAERSSTAPGLRHYSLGFRLSLRQNGFTENADSNMVVFKDANLKAEILKALGKADGELTADDLLSLKSLQIYPRVVHDLSGLEKASNLEVLQFGCQAKDLSPLASLTNLKVLHLAGTEISSLEVFFGLKNLEALSFRSCVIKDRSPLEGLPNLKVLSFEYVEILNFAPFSKLHSLEELRHNNSNVSNISDVRNLTNLKFLGVQTDATCDLSPVGFLKNLEVLHVKGARKNLGVLSKLPKIQRLVFSTTDFTDSSPLRELAGIDLKQMDLVLGNCGITDFSPLHELKIGSLQISHNPISKEQESMLRKALPDCRIVIARSSVSSPEEVHFKDANLIAAIRKALNKPEGEILEGDLLALNKLSIWEAPVSDISGLEKALNLEQLGFSHGSARGIKDFSPLAQLPEFRELYFDGASVSDLKAFSELKNLEVLSVQNTEVSDISSLRGLANLKRLDIVPTAVCDLSPLQSLQNLESLVLTGSPNELEVFTKLSKLSRLYLSKCGLVDIGPLAKLDQSLVRSLSLTNNQITDFRPLHKLKLKELFIDENPISEEQKTMLRKALPDTAIRHGGVYWQTSKEVIFKDEKLEEAVRKALNKPEGKLTREDLASMDNLKVIRHGISDVTGLEHAVNLTNLVLDWNPIGDLSPLASLTKLTSISLRSVPSGDLTPLAGLKNLKELYFGRTRLQDIAPLSGLSNLEHLSLHDTSVHDITPLAKLTKLKKVEFRLSNVKDYSVLAGLTNLESVATNRGLISDEQLTTLQRALPNCKFEITKR
jgi:Leucine-rich repeat (LRR) protein